MAFGVDKLIRHVHEHLERLQVHFDEALEEFRGALDQRLCALEEKLNQMPTREELDAAKAQLMQSIADATTRVTTDIQALRDALAAGNPITDQDLADLQADITAVGNIDPANPQPPAGKRR